MGLSVFIVDYRGSGLSDGELPAEAMMYEDAQVARDYLKTQQETLHLRPLHRFVRETAVGKPTGVNGQAAPVSAGTRQGNFPEW